MQELLLYLALGAGVGFVGGLLGIGGGIVIVPVLAWAFDLREFPAESLMHVAVGTSLATIVATSVSSVRAHHRHGAVQWSMFARLLPGFVVGAWLGAVIADMLPSEDLRRAFGAFVIVMALQTGFGRPPAPHRELPGRAGITAAGGLIGATSTIVGIAGGNLTSLYLIWCNTPVRRAVATGAAAGLPIATVGAATYLVTGLDAPALPPWSTGYVYWPAFAGIAVTSTLCAPLGARLTHTLPTTALKRAFSLFLLVVGVRMLLG